MSDSIKLVDIERMINKIMDARELAMLSQVNQMIAASVNVGVTSSPVPTTFPQPLEQFPWPVSMAVRQGPFSLDPDNPDGALRTWEIWFTGSGVVAFMRNGVEVPVDPSALLGEGPWYTLSGITGDIHGLWAAVVPAKGGAKANWPVKPEYCTVKFYKDPNDYLIESPMADADGMAWHVCDISKVTGEVRMMRRGTPVTAWNMGDTEVALAAHGGIKDGIGTAESIDRNPDNALEIKGIRDANETTYEDTAFLARTARSGRTFFGIPQGGGSGDSLLGDDDDPVAPDQRTIKRVWQDANGKWHLGFHDIDVTSPTNDDNCVILRQEGETGSKRMVQRVLAFAGI